MSSPNHKTIGLVFVACCVAVGTGLAIVGNQADPIQMVAPAQTSSVPTGIDEYEKPLGGLSNETSTRDEEVDFGGATVGMNYEEFRRRLIDAGFEPDEVDHSKECSVNPDNGDCNYQYPETDSCSGTGEAFCTYFWGKGDDGFLVLTREGEGGQVIEMSYLR